MTAESTHTLGNLPAVCSLWGNAHARANRLSIAPLYGSLMNPEGSRRRRSRCYCGRPSDFWEGAITFQRSSPLWDRPRGCEGCELRRAVDCKRSRRWPLRVTAQRCQCGSRPWRDGLCGELPVRARPILNDSRNELRPLQLGSISENSIPRPRTTWKEARLAVIEGQASLIGRATICC